MREYNSFKYIYPPRPEHKLSSDVLPKFDTGEFGKEAKTIYQNSMLSLGQEIN